MAVVEVGELDGDEVLFTTIVFAWKIVGPDFEDRPSTIRRRRCVRPLIVPGQAISFGHECSEKVTESPKASARAIREVSTGIR
jgi:hypothetical protein